MKTNGATLQPDEKAVTGCELDSFDNLVRGPGRRGRYRAPPPADPLFRKLGYSGI